MQATRARWRSATVAILVVSGCARAERPTTWPSRPVRLIVPFGPGGSADLVARLFAPILAERWRRAVVVDNRPGADGVAGVRAFVAADDGHTLLLAPMGVITTNPLLHGALPFDPVHDLVPIAPAGRSSIGIASSAAAQVGSLADLVDSVRRRPGACLWSATPGLPELVFKGFLELERLDMRHVAYSDPTAAVRDLGAGRLHLVVAALPTLHPALDGGGARLLAVTTSVRSPAAADVPTASEAGYPGLTVDSRFGFFGWKGIPHSLRDRIAGDVRHAASDEGVVSRLARMGFVVGSGTPEDFARDIEAQRRQVEDIARIVGWERGKRAGGR